MISQFGLVKVSGRMFWQQNLAYCLSVICFAVSLLDLISHQTKKDTPSLSAACGCGIERGPAGPKWHQTPMNI